MTKCPQALQVLVWLVYWMDTKYKNQTKVIHMKQLAVRSEAGRPGMEYTQKNYCSAAILRDSIHAAVCYTPKAIGCTLSPVKARRYQLHVQTTKEAMIGCFEIT